MGRPGLQIAADNGALGDAIYLASPTDMAWGPAVPGAGGSGPGTPAPGFTGEILMIAMIIIFSCAND